ncbi:hypothetical protein Cni_G12793 [Canna indica]|uniref:BZIP domain-containing protein n=1 Tax=Canna indica TaxID=4628 RepID=A0AAQ3K8G1_9LILI|nr:hypothetical protein Cni_G12793 [Canna indica]
MANMRTAATLRSSVGSGKQPFLPPKHPLSFTSSPDYGCIGSKGFPRPRESQSHHQRTSSESFLLDEQPSWLDDLLNEPETPLGRGAHRRSTSDSFACLDRISFANIGNVGQEQPGQRSALALSPWNLQAGDYIKDLDQISSHTVAKPFTRPQHGVGKSAANLISYPGSHVMAKEIALHQGASLTKFDGLKADAAEKNERLDYTQDTQGHLDKKDASLSKQMEMDPKRVKQQYAQRSRVRKLQYIAELEKHVHALQAEGLEVSAEVEFMDQQNLVLTLENNALKQRLDILAQEKLIKHYQQEMLERELVRLRSLYHQQQLKQQLQEQPCVTHVRKGSIDLNSQFSNLSLKDNGKSSGCEPVTDPLHI